MLAASLSSALATAATVVCGLLAVAAATFLHLYRAATVRQLRFTFALAVGLGAIALFATIYVGAPEARAHSFLIACGIALMAIRFLYRTKFCPYCRRTTFLQGGQYFEYCPHCGGRYES